MARGGLSKGQTHRIIEDLQRSALVSKGFDILAEQAQALANSLRNMALIMREEGDAIHRDILGMANNDKKKK